MTLRRGGQQKNVSQRRGEGVVEVIVDGAGWGGDSFSQA